MKFDLANAPEPVRWAFYRALSTLQQEEHDQVVKDFQADPKSLDVSFTINGYDVGGKAFFEAYQQSWDYALEKAFRTWVNHRKSDFGLQMENCLTEFMNRLELDPDYMKEEYDWDTLDLELSASELSE